MPLSLFPADAAAMPVDGLVARDLYTIVDGGLDRARIAALRQAVECGRYLANCARIADGVIATVCCSWRH